MAGIMKDYIWRVKCVCVLNKIHWLVYQDMNVRIIQLRLLSHYLWSHPVVLLENEHEPHTIHHVTTKDICQTTASPLVISYPQDNTKKHTHAQHKLTTFHTRAHTQTHTNKRTHLLCSHRHQAFRKQNGKGFN